MAKEPIRKIVLSDGTVRHRLVVDIGKDPVTGKRKQFFHTYDKLKDARAELARIRHERNTGTFVRPTKTTLSDYLDDWLAGHCRDLEKATARNYSDALRPAREFLVEAGGQSRELQTLEKQDIERLVEWMQTSGRKRGGQPGTGLGPRSVGLTLSALQMALDMAVAERKMAFNPVRLVKRPKQVKAKHNPWSVAEVRAFLDAIRDDRLFAVMFLSLMGLRPEEVCGLRWDRVDLEAKTVTINWARTLVAGEVVEKAPKSDAGERPLPLPSAPWSALKAFKAKQAAEKLAAGEAYEASGYVLVDELGAPWKTDKLRRRFYKLVESCGVRRVTLYDARHACLTYLAVSGVPDVVVSAWAGHADLSFTKRQYVHPSPEDLAAGRDALDKLFGTSA
jgi:integrase